MVSLDPALSSVTVSVGASARAAEAPRATPSTSAVPPSKSAIATTHSGVPAPVRATRRRGEGAMCVDLQAGAPRRVGAAAHTSLSIEGTSTQGAWRNLHLNGTNILCPGYPHGTGRRPHGQGHGETGDTTARGVSARHRFRRSG